MSTYKRGPVLLPFPIVNTNLRILLYQIPIIKLDVQVLLQSILSIQYILPGLYQVVPTRYYTCSVR